MSVRASELQLGRLTALMLAAVAVAALGGVPTWRWLGRGGLSAMAVGGAAALLASLVGLAVVLWRARRGRGALAMGFLLAGPVRLVLTLGLAGAAWSLGRWSAGPLFVWTALFYLLFLGAEVGWLSGVLRPGPSRNG